METAAPLKTTPLHDVHSALGARLVPFAGYDMPVQYAGILEEHRAVREAAGLFDVSHMGELRLRGPQALAFANALVTNDAAKLVDGKAMYAVLCHADGGAVDDLLVYRLAEDDVLLVVNASNKDKDLAHVLGEHARLGMDCTVEDESEATALLALQGPRAMDILGEVTDLPIRDVPYYSFVVPAPGAFLGCRRAILSHTGYTGEPGFEIYCESEKAVDVWNALMAAGEKHGLQPAGLGARDTLRLEAGFSLYGHELTDDITPLEAGLGWVVKLDKPGGFVGRDALARQKEAGVPRKIVGFVVEERGIPRQGHVLRDADGRAVGEVTSGSQSPTRGAGIGLGLVENDPALTAPGARVFVDVRGRLLPATVTKPPFHKTSGP